MELGKGVLNENSFAFVINGNMSVLCMPGEVVDLKLTSQRVRGQAQSAI